MPTEEKNILEFVNCLEVYQREADDFFGMKLLDIFCDYFGYANIAITSYNNGICQGVVALNEVNKLTDYYFKHFYKQDALSKYITMEQSRSPDQMRSTIRVTDVIPHHYSKSSYCEYVHRANLKYVAVMVFSNYRFCIFKHDSKSDFSDSELTHFTNLHTILSEKHKSFLKSKRKQVASRLQAHAYDAMGVGIVIYDDDESVLECNQTAITYASLAFPNKSLSQIFSEILSDGLRRNEMQNQTSTKQYGDYVFSLDSICDVDGFGVIKVRYTLQISKNKNRYFGSTDRALESLFATLSPREMEVLCAYCNGNDRHGIARMLFISESTVHSHIKNVYRKLNVTNQRTLTKMYFQYLSSL